MGNHDSKIDNVKRLPVVEEESYEHHLVIFENELSYICSVDNPLEIFSEESIENTTEKLVFLCSLIDKEHLEKRIIDIAMRHNPENFFVPALEYCYEYVSKYLVYSMQVEDERTELKAIEWKMVKVFLHLICFINFLLDSQKLSEKFHKRNLTEVLLKYLTDHSFVKKCIHFSEFETYFQAMINEDFSEILMNILYFISRIAWAYENNFEALQVTQKIQQYALLMKSLNRHDKLLRPYLILSNIMTENDLKNLTEAPYVVERIIKMFHSAAKDIAKVKNVQRKKFSLSTDKLLYEVNYVLDDSYYQWNLIEIIDSLYSLTIHDSVKFELYKRFELKNDLIKIIMFGNDIEKRFALNLMWQLSFDTDVEADLNDESKFLHSLSESVIMDATTDYNLKKTAKYFLWNLAAPKRKDNDNEGLNQIVLSCSDESNEHYAKIGEYLKSKGYKLIISSPNRNADLEIETIEENLSKSTCALILMSGAFKRCNYCRTEVHKLMQMNKRCVPLIFEDNYQPDGWLNSVIGCQSYVNFSQFPLEESLDYLIKEIQYKQSTSYSRVEIAERKESGAFSTILTSDIILINDSLRDNCFLNVESIPYIDSSSNRTSRSDISYNDTKKEKIQHNLSTGSLTKISNGYNEFEPVDWSADDVRDWYLSSGFGADLEEFLKDFDGKTLYNLYCTRADAPEYFYRTVSQNNKLSFQTVSKFITCIEQLFSK